VTFACLEYKIPELYYVRMVCIPSLKNSLGETLLEDYRTRIQSDIVFHITNDPKFKIVFSISSIEPVEYVRAIQEIEMLKCKRMDFDSRSRKMISFSSFTEVWHRSSALRCILLKSEDREELKWKLGKRFGYRMATNFVPMYAKSIYEYFNAENVLDPCAGWGDRMVGALSSNCVKTYVGFDPNVNLMPGYKKIINDFRGEVLDDNKTSVKFSNGYVIHNTLFEEGRNLISDCTFDFAFTSPPFFLMEHYGEYMPVYDDWICEFYKPLFEITHAHLKKNCFFAINLNDSGAGRVESFMLNEVPKITSFVMDFRIGHISGSSGKRKNVFVFRRTV
jgi:hypothetical protein